MVGLKRVGDLVAGDVERARVAHVDHARRAALDQARGGRLVDGDAVEELGREEVQVDFAVLVGRVEADRGRGDRRPVDGGLGEAVGQAADGDVEALAIHVTVELDARHARQRLGDVGVGELADVLGEDRIGEAGRIALGFGRVLQALAEALHHHAVQVGDLLGWRGLLSRLRLGCRVLLLCHGAGGGHAQDRRAQRARQRGSCDSCLHRTPLPFLVICRPAGMAERWLSSCGCRPGGHGPEPRLPTAARW